MPKAESKAFVEFPWAISIILYKVRKRRDVSSRTNRCRHCRAPYWYNYSIQFVGSAEFRGPILEMEQVLLIAPLMLKCLNFLENGFGIKGAACLTVVGCWPDEKDGSFEAHFEW